MKFNRWTLGLAAAGVISIPAVMQAEEASKQVLTALSSTTLSGYIDTTASWKFGTGNANMPGRVYDGAAPGYQQDGFNMNVVSLTLAKPLDEGQWSAGYNAQMLLGPGATKRGIKSIIGGGGDIGFNEAYIALRAPVGNGIDFKVGQFGTYNGYEAYDTYKNPNWSRSYGFAIESSAHTGVSASYKVNDMISLMAGIANSGGFNNQVDAISRVESKKAYLGMITLTAPESFGSMKGATLSAGYTGADQSNVTGATTTATPNWRQQNLYAGLSLPLPVTGLSLGLAYDYTSGLGSASAKSGSYANASAIYLAYKASEKLTFNNRLDYTTASDGVFYGSAKATNKSNSFVSETLTMDYSLWENVISRVEFRWDHSLSSDRPFGGNLVTTPVGTFAGAAINKNAVSVALNLIYKF